MCGVSRALSPLGRGLSRLSREGKVAATKRADPDLGHMPRRAQERDNSPPELRPPSAPGLN
jgi:hypothetical protein